MKFMKPANIEGQKEKHLMWMLAELWWPFRRRQLPALRLEIEEDVRRSNRAREPQVDARAAIRWMKARAYHPHTGAIVAKARFCCVPLVSRLYVSGLWVEAPLRRQGYATAFMVALLERERAGLKPLALTPLRESLSTHEFWRHMRNLAPRSVPVTRFFHPPGSADEDTDWTSSIVTSILP